MRIINVVSASKLELYKTLAGNVDEIIDFCLIKLQLKDHIRVDSVNMTTRPCEMKVTILNSSPHLMEGRYQEFLGIAEELGFNVTTKI